MDRLLDVTGQAYSYAGDNPVNGADPTGLCSPGLVCQGVADLGSVAGSFLKGTTMCAADATTFAAWDSGSLRTEWAPATWDQAS